MSRIFATLGADPHTLSYFWILPPLAGIIVQPIVGSLSDHTWTRFDVVSLIYLSVLYWQWSSCFYYRMRGVLHII